MTGDSQAAKEYLERLRNRRDDTFKHGVMFVDTGHTLGMIEQVDNRVPASQMELYLHGYKTRPGQTSEMQRLDIYELLVNMASPSDLSILSELIKERMEKDNA